MAYLLVSGVVTAYCGILGLVGWLTEAPSIAPRDRLYGWSDSAQWLASVMLAYQLWNFLNSVLLRDLRQLEMFAHHAMTAYLCFEGMRPYVHYYVFYFIGVAELTNVPLTLYDAMKMFPRLRELCPRVYAFAQLSFAVSFMVLRNVFWTLVSVDFWYRSIAALTGDSVHSTTTVV